MHMPKGKTPDKSSGAKTETFQARQWAWFAPTVPEEAEGEKEDAARSRLTPEECFRQDEERARVLANYYHAQASGASSSTAGNVPVGAELQRPQRRVDTRLQHKRKDVYQ